MPPFVPCHTNIAQGVLLEKGEPPVSKEYYEVFTDNDSHGKILKKLYNSLALSCNYMRRHVHHARCIISCMKASTYLLT